MGKSRLVVIHYNPRLSHQVDHARAWEDGLARHGVRCWATPDARAEGDVHIVSGPHYALPWWQNHPRTIWLDRCLYGDPRGDVSLAWIARGARRIFPTGSPPDRWRATGQALHPLKPPGPRITVFGDFRFHVEQSQVLEAAAAQGEARYRPHPHAQPWAQDIAPEDRRPLEEVLADTDTAIGWASTALVAAALAGCRVECRDPAAPAYRISGEEDEARRAAWCYDLAHANWSVSEIATGAAWEYLHGTEPH